MAELMVETGERMGKKIVALITDMDQPLGLKVGNSLEIEECIDVLRGGGPADLRQADEAGQCLLVAGGTDARMWTLGFYASAVVALFLTMVWTLIAVASPPG